MLFSFVSGGGVADCDRVASLAFALFKLLRSMSWNIFRMLRLEQPVADDGYIFLLWFKDNQ